MSHLLLRKFLLLCTCLVAFSITVFAQPANDNPCNATPLAVGSSCTFSQYTTVNATASPGVPAPGCANYQGGDVWFSAVVPASGSITFDTNTGGMTDGGMAIYTGTCNALTLLGCNDDGSANGLMPSLTETGLTPGATIFIRVWEYGNDNQGTFSICAQAGPSCNGSSGNATCASANPFCTGVSYDYCNTTGVPSIGGSGIYGCLLTAPNPAFYFMNIQTAGPVTFNISQQTFGGVAIDVDFVLWGPFASQGAMCSSIAAGNIVDCSYSTAAVETATIPNAQVGEWYMMLITNYSDQGGVINFNQTNSNTPGAGATNCNIVTATPGTCSGGFYTLTGSVTVPSPPASGTLTVTNSCGGSQVINAPFTSPINYSIPNICGNGNNCTVSAVFSAGGAPTILPTTYTAPSCNTLTATPGSCTVGQYTLSGTLTTGCLPVSGTLTISSSCGGSVVFNAPFTSPLSWTLPPSNGNGGSCTVTAVYSAAGAPIITPFTFTEPSCCGTDAGTITTTQVNGTQTTLPNGTTQVVLCPNGTVNLVSNNNYSLPTSGCAGCVPGLMYGIYATPGPTVPDPDLDPNWTGYYWTGEDFTTANSGGYNTNSSGACSPLLTLPPIAGYASPSSPNNTLIFVPITADATDLPNHDANDDGCFDIGSPIAITFLNPISYQTTPNCSGSVDITITGGYPQFFPALYTVTNTGAGSLSSTTATSGGTVTVSGLTPGQTYSISVNDGNGCSSTYSGVYSGPPVVNINPSSATVCTGGCVNLNATVTSGVGSGNLTFTSNQCAVIPDGGIGSANGNPTAVGGNWAHTSINVAGVCAPAWNTGELITVCLNISHTYDADLNIYLQAPNGSYYLLSQDNGGAGVNYNGTCFSATAATNITAGTAPFSGSYIPQGGAGTFAGLNGTPINGNWTLWVADDVALDGGTLNSWSITFANENTYTYSWTPATGLSATNILNPTACPAATTTYSLTVTNSCGCQTTATTTVTVSSSITPTFNTVGPICSGSTAPVLPTTSTNGITGTWSPATVSNTATATYTFTPAAGQCAVNTTLTVTVNPTVTPTFNAIAPICSGATAPVLPTTSTNGITGTWSPATVNNLVSASYTFTPDPGQCAAQTSLTVTVNNNTTPTFAAVAAICSGDALAPLPTTSTNGINGTWAPALNNTTTTTYTF
ncbi:MAG: proprotein convertase P-domain-containing protein, partial [Bacteroidetes bacterium]|nr:proprotein convertase P-domain-containing protein [Bacteroidota bacterium]